MNYQRHYNLLIEKAKSRGWTYKDNSIANPIEVHHIIPKSMGGSDDKDNLVGLTIREHVIAHFLLAKSVGGKAWRAAFGMTNGHRLSEINSKIIESIKINSRELIRNSMIGNTNGSYEWSEERLKIHTDAMQRVGFTEAKHEALKKAWAKNTGSTRSEEAKQKQSLAMKANGFVPVKAGDFDTCSKAGKANKGVKKSFRSEDHSKNWRATLAKKYPHWNYYDDLYLLWINNNKPTYSPFMKLVKEHGYPEAHYGKMIAKFKEQAL